ncbi:MAG: cyclic nucleotide-binding domain-containing protein [Candidatus Hydrogenedentes bacterium]|nr:cyclic nucleotide-binding domain-containing protein [Candidatus Hydrogenedentota bacterium]
MPEPFAPESLDIAGSAALQAVLARCPHAECIKYRNDEYLITKGDASQEVFLLIRGSCVVEAYPPQENAPRGGELALLEGKLDHPTVLGEMAYLGEGLRTASVRSVMNTWTIRLQPEDLDVIIAQIPELARILCTQFTARLREANRQITRFQQKLQMQFEERFLAAGETLYEAGAPADILYQLLSGTLLLDVNGEISECRSGDEVFVEPAAYFRDLPCAATVKAKGPAMLMGVNKDSKEAVIRNFPQLILKLLG